MDREERLKLQLTERVMKEFKISGWTPAVAAHALDERDSLIYAVFKFEVKKYSTKKLIAILEKLGFEFEIKLTKI